MSKSEQKRIAVMTSPDESLSAELERVKNDNSRLTKIIAKEFNENDELGMEYTHVVILKEQLVQSQALCAKYKLALEKILECVGTSTLQHKIAREALDSLDK